MWWMVLLGRQDHPQKDPRNSMISVHPYPASAMFRVAALALAIFIFGGGYSNAQSWATQGSASSQGPFGQLAGSWSGSGTIDLSNGRHEPIKCRASYDVLQEQNKLQLNIHCASESYSFDLRGSATYTAGAITGNWSKLTRNAAGTMSGKVAGVSGRRQGADFHRQFELGDTWRQAVRHDQVTRREGRRTGRDNHFAARIARTQRRAAGGCPLWVLGLRTAADDGYSRRANEQRGGDHKRYASAEQKRVRLPGE